MSYQAVILTVSDSCAAGTRTDTSGPAIRAMLENAGFAVQAIQTVPDEEGQISAAIVHACDILQADLVVTTGGTGLSPRDVTPEATLAVATREMPGFGEQMRAISGHFVPTAILSRQVGVLRETPDHAALILNLPGQPKAIAETLEGLKDKEGNPAVNGIFAAVPYCIDLIGGPYIETNEAVVKAFRPKSARKHVEKPQEAAVPSPQPAVAKAPVHQEEPLKRETSEAAPRSEEKPASEVPPAKPAFDARDLLVVRPRTGGDAELAVVWLHGMGVDNTDFAPFPDEILGFDGPVCRFILPNAPMREMSMHPGYPLRAWYDVPGRSIDENEDARGIRESAKRVSQLIDEIEAQGIPRNRIVLGGFSQGAAISLFAGLRMERPIGGVAALSGYIPLAGHLFSEATPGGRRTPIFMAHGEFDSVVPPVMAARSAEVISQVDPAMIARTYPMDHELCQEEMHDLAAFLRNIVERAAN